VEGQREDRRSDLNRTWGSSTRRVRNLKGRKKGLESEEEETGAESASTSLLLK